MPKCTRVRTLFATVLISAAALVPAVNSPAASGEPARHHHHRHWHLVAVLGWHRGSRKAGQPHVMPASHNPPGGGGPWDPGKVVTQLHDADGHPFPLREHALIKIVMKHNLTLFFTHLYFLHTHRPAHPRARDLTTYEYRNSVSQLRCLNPEVLSTCDPVPADRIPVLGVVKFAPVRNQRFNKGVVTLYCPNPAEDFECPDWVATSVAEP